MVVSGVVEVVHEDIESVILYVRLHDWQVELCSRILTMSNEINNSDSYQEKWNIFTLSLNQHFHLPTLPELPEVPKHDQHDPSTLS